MSRLTAERVLEIFECTLTLMVEHGYDNLTMDGVAAQTHTSKATLYRQWGSKRELVLASLLGLADEFEAEDIPDTGSLAGDLHALIDLREHDADQAMDLISAISNATRHDPELARALRTTVVSYWDEFIDQLLQRAISRGEIADEIPARRFAHEMFLAPMLYYGLLLNEPHDVNLLHDYIDHVILPAFGARSVQLSKES